MKILQINAVHRHLSTGRNMAQLNQYFREQGHQTMAAYSVGTVTDSAQEYRIGDKLGQKLHGVLSRISGLQGYYSGMATGQFLKFLDDYRPDVVLLNNLHANYIHLPKLLKYLAKKDIPTVAVLHDCWFYTGKCCHYTVAGCYRWQEGCGKCVAKKKYNKSWLFDRSKKMLRDKKEGFGSIPRLGVIAVSDWLLGEAKKAPVFHNAVQMQRIYNWIDTETFRPVNTDAVRQKMGLQDEKVVLCVASAWDETKGLSTVLEIAAQLGEGERMILVGNLPAGTVIPARMRHIPKTDNVETLVELYNLADVFFQPSPEETFGKVSAEALCCGTPVVCFRSTANPELVGDGCGFVVEPGDREGALSKIRQLFLQGKDEKTCRDFATGNFEMANNCRQYLDFCLQMTKGGKP